MNAKPDRPLLWTMRNCFRLARLLFFGQRTTTLEAPERPLIELNNLQMKELHQLLIDRIYHEDSLFAQRTYNFLTANAFLAAALAFSTNMAELAYVIGGLGFILALCHLALGRRTERTILFWREYLKRLEEKLDVRLDSALIQFFKTANAKTPVGLIVGEGDSPRPMYRTFPWCLRMHSTNTLLGVVLPSFIGLFWMMVWFIVLKGPSCEAWITCSVLLIFLIVSTFFWLPSKPQDISNDQPELPQKEKEGSS